MSPRRSQYDSELWVEALTQADRRVARRSVRLLLPGREVGCNLPFRFGVSQGEKLRAAGYLKQSSTNRAAQGSTLIKLPTWDHLASMIKSMMDQCGGLPLGIAKADHQAAYRQLPLRPDQRRLATITLRDPRSGDWRPFLPNTQLFGSATAAHRYNCLSGIIATQATRLLRVPTLEYSDDFGLVTPHPLTEGALSVFTEPDGILGFVLKVPGAEWGEISEFLGLIIDLPPLPCSSPLLYLSQFKEDILKAQIFEILKVGRVAPAALQEVVRKRSCAQTSTTGKVVRTMLRPFFMQSNPDVGSRALFLSSRAARERRYQALSASGPRSLRSLISHFYRRRRLRGVRSPLLRYSLRETRGSLVHI